MICYYKNYKDQRIMSFHYSSIWNQSKFYWKSKLKFKVSSINVSQSFEAVFFFFIKCNFWPCMILCQTQIFHFFFYKTVRNKFFIELLDFINIYWMIRKRNSSKKKIVILCTFFINFRSYYNVHEKKQILDHH